MNLETIMSALGGLAKVLGVLTAVGGVWASLGLPLPATVAYVDGRVSAVLVSLADVKTTILEGQLRDIGSQRALLRNEKGAIERSLDRAPEATRLVLGRRIGDIEDALARLTREEETVSTKLHEGKK